MKLGIREFIDYQRAKGTAVKYFDLSSNKRSLWHWINFAVASLLAIVLAGCSSDSNDNNSPPIADVTTTTLPATAAVPVPPGTPLDASTLTATQFAALTPTVPVDASGNQSISVTIASPPKVTFALTDGAGGPPIKGFGSKAAGTTVDGTGAAVTSTPNLSFALAKLIPESPATLQGRTLIVPSRWVSYIVTTARTKNATSGAITEPAPTRPTTDNTGTLVDNGNGTYTYTFYRDITQAKTIVAAGTETAVNKNADLDDLAFDPNMVHRVSIQISGNAPGTGSNTPTGVADAAKPGVPMTKPANVIFDFIPATGKAAPSGRDIAATQKCNDCHQSLGGFPGASAANVDAEVHGGSRNKVEYCVVCHTDQRKYGRAEAVVNAAGNYDGKSTYRINGLGVGMLSTHIHKIHMSANLVKTGYNYGDILYEEACKFPQDVRNCTKCHDGSATSTTKTAQGDNWMKVPNRRACGACHDGITFITGAGVTLANKNADVAAGVAIGTTADGHAGGPQSDDAACGFCHAPADIDLFHIPVTPPNALNALANTNTDAAILANPALARNANTNAAFIASNTSRLPAGAIKVTYNIQSVTRNASRNPVMVFQMLQNGAAVAFNTFDPAKSLATQEIWPNFMGAPSVYFVYAIPQDGIAAPADFNADTKAYLRDLWNGNGKKGTLTGPVNGFYTATLAATVPDNAVMLTGGLGYSYNNTSTLPLTQTNVAGYPTNAVPAALVTQNKLDPNMPNRTGGLIVVAPDKQVVASAGAAAAGTGGAYTGRRTIVDDTLCNKCHQELGPFTEDAFHAGQRNDGTTCAWCHTPNKTSSGWSVDSTNFIHAIHAAAKRNPVDTTQPQAPFTYDAVSTTDGFFTIGYPGVLKTCTTCHTPDGFDFSSAAATAALPNRLYRTVATGIFNGTVGAVTAGCTPSATSDCKATALSVFRLSPDVVKDNVKDYGAGYNTDTAVAGVGVENNLVNSPIATACFACHATTVAKQHMQSNGGSIYDVRGKPAAGGGVAATGALARAEQCLFCHSSTSAFGLGIKAVHAGN